MSEQAGLTLVQAAIIAALSAFVTSALAQGRFGRQKWWERRSARYEEIAGQLLEQKLFSAEMWKRHSESTGKSLTPTDEERMPAEVAGKAIERRIEEGQLLLSKSALRLLE